MYYLRETPLAVRIIRGKADDLTIEKRANTEDNKKALLERTAKLNFALFKLQRKNSYQYMSKPG